MAMTVSDLRSISPKSFSNKHKGYIKNTQESWQLARFIALTAGNSNFYKKPLKHKDYKFEYEKEEMPAPTKPETEWMDKHFGRTL